MATTLTKEEIATAFMKTRNRAAMAELLMRLRRLDVDRALYLLEAFGETLVTTSYSTGHDVGYSDGQRDAQEQQECEACNGD